MTLRFIVKSGNLFMKVEPPNRVTFISNIQLANSYPSKYAAKCHLRQLDGVPKEACIVEINND